MFVFGTAVICRLATDGAVQALEDDRQRREAELERSKSVLEGERAELQRARGDLDRFSARVKTYSGNCVKDCVLVGARWDDDAPVLSVLFLVLSTTTSI